LIEKETALDGAHISGTAPIVAKIKARIVIDLLFMIRDFVMALSPNEGIELRRVSRLIHMELYQNFLNMENIAKRKKLAVRLK